MRKNFFAIFVFVIVSITNSVAQVGTMTVGALDTPNATLDVRSQTSVATAPDGIIAPKLTGDELAAKSNVYGANQNGTIVYVTRAAGAANLTGKTYNVRTPGYYYYDAASAVWIGIAKDEPQWFYMPPSLIDTDAGPHSINLWNRYNQSITSMATTPAPLTVKSVNSPDFSTICMPLTANDFYYYVVGYDTDLFSNITITGDGWMTYNSSGNVTDDSYINIVFVRKPTAPAGN